MKETRKTTLLKNVLIAGFLLFSITVTAQLDLNFNTDGDFEGCVIAGPNGPTSSVSGGLLTLSSSGNENIQIRKNATNAGTSGEFKTVIIDVKNNSNADKILVKRSNADLGEIAITTADTAEKSYSFTIDNTIWTGATNQLRLQFVVDGGGTLDANTIEINRIQVVDPSSLSVGNNILEGVAIYPNPASGFVSIKSLKGANIKVYSIVGKLIKSEISQSKEHIMNVSDLNSGVYLVKLTSENKIATKKLIIK